jgi:hypothetical protein
LMWDLGHIPLMRTTVHRPCSRANRVGG